MSTEMEASKFSKQKFYGLMRYERLRLLTYLLFGHQWPKMDIISPSVLASAGFFYFKDDSVKCSFCRIVISDWQEGDDPLEEHRKHSPNCDMFDEKTCTNVPLDLDPDVNSTVEQWNTNFISPTKSNSLEQVTPYNETEVPRYPLFSDIQNRSRTFKSKSWTSTVSTKRLYESGFFYTGKEDRTRCFHCGGMLYQWKKTEDPMEEHARFFPQCYFIHTIKGKTFVEFIQFKTQIIQLREKMDTPKSVTMKDVESMRLITFQNFVNMKQSASKLFQKLEHPCTAISSSQASQPTSGSQQPSSYYQRYLKKFFFLMDCQVLFQHLVSMDFIDQPMPRARSPVSDTGYNSSSSSDRNEYLSGGNGTVFSFCEDSGADSDGSNSSLRSFSSDDDDDDRLRPVRDLTCIICYNNAIEVVFTPCGHQLSCRSCSDKFDKCPTCRSKITDKIRTFFVH